MHILCYNLSFQVSSNWTFVQERNRSSTLCVFVIIKEQSFYSHVFIIVEEQSTSAIYTSIDCRFSHIFFSPILNLLFIRLKKLSVLLCHTCDWTMMCVVDRRKYVIILVLLFTLNPYFYLSVCLVLGFYASAVTY